jgi:hypothetical protein
VGGALTSAVSSFDYAPQYQMQPISAASAVATGSAAQLGEAINDLAEKFQSAKDSLAETAQSLAIDLLRAMGNEAGAAQAERANYLAGFADLTQAERDHLGVMYDQNQAVRDQIAAIERANVVAMERTGLERQILELTGDVAAIREIERASLDESNRSLYDRINALNDEREASALLAEQQRAIEQERSGIMGNLLQALGRTQDIRAREVEGLDPSNRGLQEQIFQIADAKSALEKALAAESVQAQAAKEAAQERVSSLKSIFDTLKSGVDSLRDSVESTRQLAATQANAFLDSAISAARSTGYLPDADELNDAIAGATSGLERQFSSEKDREFEALVLAGKLEELQDLTGGQLTNAELQLEAAESQLDVLGTMQQQGQALLDSLSGNTVATLSIVDAVSQLSQAVLSASRSVSGGTSLAPSSAGFATSGSTQAATSGLVTSAYAAIGRTAGFGDGSQNIDMEGFEYWTNQLATGKLSEENFKNEFLIAAASYQGSEFSDAAEEARKLLGLPGFAVGTNFVPNDMIAQVHKGEMIIPAAYNPATSGIASGRLETLVAGLTAEVQRLQEIVRTGNQYQMRTANAVNGNPDQPMIVEVVA